jgi:hypothetical protein
MSKGKTTTVQEASLPAFQEAQFQELFGRARGLSQQPFIPYTGPMVAGFNFRRQEDYLNLVWRLTLRKPYKD